MTRLEPPRWAERLLARSLGPDPANGAILGDLREDFARAVDERGRAAARRWYIREALLLTVSRRLRGGTAATARHAHPSAFVQDARYALRSLARAPAFALFAALVLGLGIGATTSVFSVLRPLVLAPLPFEEPGELVWLEKAGVGPGDRSLSAITVRSGNLRDFREGTRSFAGLTGYNAFFQSPYTLEGDGEPELVTGVDVAHDFLDVLGVPLLHGRNFTEDEGRWGGPAAVILTHGLWQRRFAGEPSVVGRALMLNGTPRTVVGVLPPSFDFSSIFTPGVQVDFLLPFPVGDETNRWGNTMLLLGRLQPGVGPDQAEAELDAVVAGLREAQPDRWGIDRHRVVSLQAHIAGPFHGALGLLGAAAAMVLLIACVNVSNLLLARAPGRSREVAVRKALGASRGRLVRQLLLEATGIALAGAFIGAAVAWGATRFVAGTAGVRVPMLDRVEVDALALVLAVGLALVTGLVVGLVPALQVPEGGEAGVLRSGGRGASASRRARRLREWLVVSEVALACVLLVVGGLLVQSFRAVLDVDMGFRADHVVAWQLNPAERFASNEAAAAFYLRVAERVAQVPGVEHAGLIDALPLGKSRSWGYSVVGVPEEDDTDDGIHPHIIDAGYLSAMGIGLVRGRDFSADDRADTPPVVLMNESGARQVFAGQDPLGQRIRVWGDQEWEIVGIVQDVRHLGPENGPGTQVYFPLGQMPDYEIMELAVRSSLPVAEVAAGVAAALTELDPSMPAREFWTVRSSLDRTVSARRFTLTILTAYGAVALFLAGLGIYGVLAQSVAERRAEIGIRMALGASAPDVVRDVMSRTLVLTGVGAAIGAAASLAGAGLLRSQLFGVSTTDPGAFLAGGLLLFLVAALAGGVPALRASRVRGVRALQAE